MLKLNLMEIIDYEYVTLPFCKKEIYIKYCYEKYGHETTALLKSSGYIKLDENS